MCTKAGAECTFYDHALKQSLPRAYVQSLLTRVAHLQAVRNGNAGSKSTPPRQQIIFESASNPMPAIRKEAQEDHETQGSNGLDINTSFDVIIPSRTASGRSRYWGSSSVFALTVEILHHAVARGYLPQENTAVDSPSFGASETAVDESENDASSYSRSLIAPEADIRSLVQLYLVSINTLYGFVDPAETTVDLQTYLRLREQRTLSPAASVASPVSPTPLPACNDDVHRYFRISMMCAIACANQARYRPYRAGENLAYYADAVSCVEEVTSEASPSSLRALLLLIVYCLFYPRKGDIWKLLDYACRLTIELGYHTEPRPGGGETDAQSRLRRSTFWGLYAIERIVGQLFGRGSDLPETVITTEYPSSLYHTVAGSSNDGNDSIASTGGPPDLLNSVDQPTLQVMSIGHHYRLVYLRSEIFRSMYLPATAPSPNLDWLRGHYTTLHAWRQELAVSDELEGVATLTCDVGYDATICFMFQPQLLRALHTTATAPLDLLTNLLLASDPFYCAINLIRTYEKVVRAPQRSVRGTYPMTFLSAHYIYLASSTLISYALLRLDGRLCTLRRMCDIDHAVVTVGDAEELDWGAFIDVSSSCLILLAWCAERWPEMVGMLAVHQKIFNRAVRDLVAKSIVR